MSRSRLLRKKYVVPAEHGSWTWWLGPFLVGLAAGGRPGGGVAALFAAAMAGFLLHQPAAVAVKALAGRYPRSDLAPALAWVGIWTAVAGLAIPCLLLHHHARILLFVAPGVALFAWHLVLVARRDERHHPALPFVTAGALALAGPAAYVVAGGDDPAAPWALGLLLWLHSATAILAVTLRLAQRTGPEAPPPGTRIARGRPLLLAHGATVLATGAFAAAGTVPPLLLLALLPPLADAILAISRPAFHVPPRRIGMRQLLVDLLWVALASLSWIAQRPAA